MGATNFWHTANGKTPEEAFRNARQEARYEHGHGGYSGTIAEKNSFVLAKPPAGTDPNEFCRLIENEGVPSLVETYNDKWGPAVCVPLGGDRYVFLGMASC